MTFDKVEILKVDNGYIITGFSKYEQQPVIRIAQDWDEAIQYLNPPKVKLETVKQ
ncbi:hypothetical protein [Caudoviricetes sp.]|jgi:hypothetical protein|nr:hypothetical protein [Caudoviricetes sp.]